ncbi:MAG: endonuclease [Dehalococcoidaceae bacterium]|nr:endonuclease [Dehalococcoidaceae bacterium]
MQSEPISRRLGSIYRQLLEHFGRQYWWPGETPFEVMAGAVLTQSTAWENAARAILNLKKAGCLNPAAIRRLPAERLARHIRPSGYFNTKARKLQALTEWLGKTCSDNIDLLSGTSTATLRNNLLAVYGIGPETADSILLYGLNRPVFVIDAYTRRITDRLGILPGLGNGYNDYQKLFAANTEPDVSLYNEFHALLVKQAKTACRKSPLCCRCCLLESCLTGKNGVEKELLYGA